MMKDPNGLFLCGDTAQCIARGVGFRFCELRSLFHTIDKHVAGVNVPVPVLHTLRHNYRSHNGILQMASSVVRLLYEWFNNGIDRLDDDVGLLNGPSPVVLTHRDPTDLHLLVAGHQRDTAVIEFGAHQVVLVRSEKARDELPEDLLACGIVLTIHEAKGLEFDDVLLYNFFHDSPAQKQWGCVSSTTHNSSTGANKLM